MFNFLEAEVWVGVGLLLFFGLLIWFKVPNAAAKALDARGEKIQAALNEAQRLRDEARTLLASIKARHEATEALATQMLQEAELEAKRLGAEAKSKLEEQIARRTALADRRIALAEAQAAQDVKAAAVELAAEMAETILAERAARASSDPLIDRSIAELASRLQ
jgi:F-type H+-transporting ATPase subunit b